MEELIDVFSDFNTSLIEANSVNEIEAIVSIFKSNRATTQKIKDKLKDKASRQLLSRTLQKCLFDVYQHSALLNHCITKPLGYPGDFIILEHIYDQEHFSCSTNQGKLIDLWAINTTLPDAVRRRKDVLCFLLSRFIREGAREILSIGSGTAREIRELDYWNDDVVFDLVDSDPNTESFFLSKTDRPVNFIIENAFLKRTKVESYYDLMYSFGLFDYLSDSFIDRLIKIYIPQLKNDGYFVFSLKDENFYQAWFYDAFCDWRFIPRNKESGFSIADRNGLKVTDAISTENQTVTIYVCKLKD